MFIIHFITTLLSTVISCDQSTNTLDQDDIFPVNITMKDFKTIRKDQNMYIQYKIPDEELFISVGFAVGRNTPHKYIIINIHYLFIGKRDNFRLHRKYHANILLTGSSDIILPPKTKTIQVPFSCYYTGQLVFFFAAAIHTHMWGRVNSLYRVRNGNVTLIIKDSPQIHQAFTSLSLPIDVKSGDYLIIMMIETTRNDEMCKIYVMYAYIPKNTTSNHETIDQQSPFPVCWDNQISSMIDLIPADSIIPLPIPKDHQIHMHGSKSSSTNFLYNGESLMIDDTEMFASPDSLKPAITRRFSFNHEILVVLWIILLTILILFLMVCCIIHICMNKNAIDVNNNDITIASIFTNCMNPQKKSKRLESDVDEDDSPSSLIANDETIINMESKLTTIIINDKNSAVIC
ncbi:unnamed protein product [Adineta steineri]|uniref:Copper type II ascorbate-dependent monooxygenase C-terminal domain-containing protein n=1 Tax=Adineta steineri TaxID=433720 RepID=A0A814QL50_9BILA|nr:unnamed protein product [Adineta steineri]CAF3936531.1 unnamed protein product [Adineta steineri]